MVEDDEWEQILHTWDKVDEHHTSEVVLSALTTRLAKIIHDLHRRDVAESRLFCDKFVISSVPFKLLTILQVTQSHKIQRDVLSILEDLSVYRAGYLYLRLLPSSLWSVLTEIEFKADVLTDYRYVVIDILTRILRNKNIALKVCQTVEPTQLFNFVFKLLESKEGSRKLILRRQKSAANIISSISRNREGRQLINEAKIVDRLHAFLLTLPNEKSRDTIIHKVGQTILRCVPLRQISGVSNGRSAFSYSPFAAAVVSSDLATETSSDSSEVSDLEEENAETPQQKRKKIAQPPKNIYRSCDSLEQYREYFDRSLGRFEDDELTSALKDVKTDWVRSEVYEYFARRTRSIHGFELIPCPDWLNASGNLVNEVFFIKDREVCRNKMLKTLTSLTESSTFKPKVVFDLDSLLLVERNAQLIRMTDFEKVSDNRGNPELSLAFESRFESGNLRHATRIGPHEYNLLLNPDVNSYGRQQWFYFRLSGEGVCSSTTYTFNIINLEKQRTLFNQGMQPVVFSVKNYLATGQSVWEHKGMSICYYRNGFRKASSDQSYWTLSFDLEFQYDNDVLYVAYHYPYTYSQMMTDIAFWQRKLPVPDTELSVSMLCKTPSGNPVPLLLINYSQDAKSCCVFMSRVHPCESNSSWVMRGLVNAALQDSSGSKNNHHPLLILPMLNVDGTVHGCSRTELSNEDLNRRWLQPDMIRHPTIYHAKGVIEFMCKNLKARPTLLCDMHGHSRRFNTFVYGCKASQSWYEGDHILHMEPPAMNDSNDLPPFVQLLLSELFLLDSTQCCFEVEKNREGTARVVGWRHFGITNTYTLECSLAGSDQHSVQAPQHFNTDSYFYVGEALFRVSKRLAVT